MWRSVGLLIIIMVTCLLTLGVALAAERKPAWQVEWEKTLEAARKEGQVTVYISGGYEAILPEFEKEYPEIKVITVTGRGNQLGPRILSERRVGKYLADVVSAGANPNYQQLYLAKALDPIKAAVILPEVVDPSKWYEGKHRYADAEGQYVFVYVGTAGYGGIRYNTKLVNPKEFGSFYDFLNPKWKEKMEARDIREAGPGSTSMRLFYYHPEIGPGFIRRLFGEMDLTLFLDFRQGTDWLATGKFAICFFCDVDVAKKQGLPVDSFPGVFKEGGEISHQFGTLVLMNQAPHPNAARVLVNWFLSRTAQWSLQKKMAQSESPLDSLRIDIPKDDVPLDSRRLFGVKYFDTTRPEIIDMAPIYKIVNEVLKEARKK